jgi:hypothetical protein
LNPGFLNPEFQNSEFLNSKSRTKHFNPLRISAESWGHWGSPQQNALPLGGGPPRGSKTLQSFYRKDASFLGTRKTAKSDFALIKHNSEIRKKGALKNSQPIKARHLSSKPIRGVHARRREPVAISYGNAEASEVRGKKKGKMAAVEKNKPAKEKENEREKEGDNGLMSKFFSPNRFRVLRTDNCVLRTSHLAEEESGFFLERKLKAKIILSKSPGKTNKVLLVMGKRVTRKGKKNDPGSIQEEAETGAEEENPPQQEEPKELPHLEATDSGLEEGLEVEVPAEVPEPAHVGLDSESEGRHGS